MLLVYAEKKPNLRVNEFGNYFECFSFHFPPILLFVPLRRCGGVYQTKYAKNPTGSDDHFPLVLLLLVAATFSLPLVRGVAPLRFLFVVYWRQPWCVQTTNVDIGPAAH